ncbi:MAG TPA: XdhC family protein [Spirochaetia bacterium]|nr:XdhC family protein [Spirochaetia bacterium]
MEEVLRAALEELEAGRTCVLVTVIEVSGHTPAKPGAKLLVRGEGEAVGTVGGGGLEKLCVEKARRLLSDGDSALIHYALDEEGSGGSEMVQTPMVCGGKVSVFFERIGGMSEVHLFGAGHIGRSLSYFLAPLAFRVHVYDDRDEALTSLPDQPRQEKRPLALPENAKALPASVFVVIATHSHELDFEIVKSILSSDLTPRYIGIVASRRKWKLFLARLEAELPAGFDRTGLYAPCGLSIASRDPREIALAIVAEILSVRDGVEQITHMKEEAKKG